jgi:hypothetical protein
MDEGWAQANHSSTLNHLRVKARQKQQLCIVTHPHEHSLTLRVDLQLRPLV